MTAKNLTMPLLARRYQMMIDRGLIHPVETFGDFEYPSALSDVPTITTSDVGALNAKEPQGAGLGPNSE